MKFLFGMVAACLIAFGMHISGPVASNPALAAQVSNSAVILMYHRFGEGEFPTTNIRLEQFDAHLKELSSGPYTVLPVESILTLIKKGQPVPDRTVGITIDDGYRSIYTEAWPRLKKAGFPFTIFVATDAIDRGRKGMLSWDQIREMRKNGVTIGAHTASHLHMPAADPVRNQSELIKSNNRLAEEMQEIPNLFAYPYGETSTAIQQLSRKTGYLFALGQHSGVVNKTTDFNYIPRFAMNENFGSLSRFRLVINALPLPVRDLTPTDPLVTSVNPPHLGFTVASHVGNLNRLSCFSSAEGRVGVELLGGTRIEVRMTKEFGKGRTRVNCTLPGPGGRWRWFGTLFNVVR